MKKTFKLPKEFAERWIVALESGKYKQGPGTLFGGRYQKDENGELDYSKPNMKTSCFCCLGVAAVMQGCSPEDIDGDALLWDNRDFYLSKGIPDVLTETSCQDNLVGVLANLNDIFTPYDLKKWSKTFPDLKFSVPVNFDKINYTFKEIAEFIKLNVEFV